MPKPMSTPAFDAGERPVVTGSWGRAYIVVCVLFTALYAAVLVTTGAPFSLAVRSALFAAAPNALLGLVAARLAWRWPSPGEPGHPLHLLRLPSVLVLLALAATAAWVLLIVIETWFREGAFAFRTDPRIVVWEFLISLLLQAVAAGAGYARYNGLRAREESARAARADLLRTRAELALLRSQLNPHFLMNTLHALLGLVRREPAVAEAAVERLGELLAYGLRVHRGGADRVAFRDEWAFVKSYLEIERLRLGDRLRLTLDAEDAAMEIPVPPFAVQPLVENAIIHAIAPRRTGGSLDVTARRAAGRLEVEVRDDGPGSSEAALWESPRLGLRLLRERLATLYGGQARLSFESPPGGGLRAVLELPENGFSEAA
jgi:hypothetical protein